MASVKRPDVERLAEREAVLGAPRLELDELRKLLGRLVRPAGLHEHLGNLEVEHRVGPDRACRSRSRRAASTWRVCRRNSARARLRSAGSWMRSVASPRLRSASAGRPLSASFSACIQAATRLCGDPGGLGPQAQIVLIGRRAHCGPDAQRERYGSGGRVRHRSPPPLRDTCEDGRDEPQVP